MLMLTAIQQLDIQLQARGESLTVSQIVRHLHIGRREALALLDAYRSAPPVDTTPERFDSDEKDLELTTSYANGATKREEAAPGIDPAPVERPLVLCQRCGYSAWFEWDIGIWRCRLCGIGPPP
jgi:hypothetical protein